MTQPFTDALTWVPKSRALAISLARANDLARAQGHRAVTLEHVLSALIEDPDASAVLLASNVDLLKLNDATNTHLQQQPSAGSEAPEAAPAVLAILEYAVAAARQSKRSEVNGAIVVAAIVGEGNSVAARMLQAQGMTFEKAVQALKRASAQPARPTASAAPTPAAAAIPPVPQQALPPAPAAAAGLVGDDPLTTARRRIEAMRSGHAAPPMPAPAAASLPAANPISAAGPTDVEATPGLDAVAAQPPPIPAETTSGTWAPPPLPPQPTTPPRPPRMPPPIPPLASPPQRSGGPVTGAAQAAAPWTDPTLPRAEPASATVIPFPANRAGMPIDPARLIDKLPKLLKTGVATTIEVRIARSAVHATAQAMGAAPEAALTRALTVRLKAPAGGVHIETAAPETQWFDLRQSGRDDEEVRWRWIITAHATGPHPLLLAIGMRTLVNDGVNIDSVLPEHTTDVRVIRPLSELLVRSALLIGAAAGGALVMFMASGGLRSILRMFG